MEMTVGEALIRAVLPPDVYQGEPLSAKTVKNVLAKVAEKYPDKFPDISLRLTNLGADIAYRAGNTSLTWEELRPTYELDPLRQDLEKRVQAILDDPKMPQDVKDKRIVDLVSKYDDLFLDKTKEIIQQRNGGLALQMASGARGKPTDLRRLLTGDILYIDHRNRPIPVPVLRGYNQGLTPAQYWLASYGARKGFVTTNLGTATAGYLSKQLANAAHQLVVTDIDGPENDPLPRGLPASVDDTENIGAFLAVDAGPYKKNTPITADILADLKNRGIENILVRSVLTRRAPDGGVYARDVGLFENGRSFSPGDMVGVIASQSLGEPVTQMVIGAKHSGGTGKTVVDISTLEHMIQVPKVYKGATHTTVTGPVTKIEEAPAGGYFVYVNQTPHYVLPQNAVKVKVGDEVEAGDLLSEGIPNPSKIVTYKGLGEGRRYYVDALRDIYKQTGFNLRRRNFELLVAGLLDHVKFNSPYGNYLPGEVVKYSWVERNWQPREGSQWVPVEKAVGKYLETPVLHHTIGTQLQKSMADELRKYGIQTVLVHEEPPPFEFYMSPAAKVLDYDPDWLVRTLGGTFGQRRSLLKAVQEGHTSSLTGTSFVPSLASGIGFGTTWPVDNKR